MQMMVQKQSFKPKIIFRVSFGMAVREGHPACKAPISFTVPLTFLKSYINLHFPDFFLITKLGEFQRELEGIIWRWYSCFCADCWTACICFLLLEANDLPILLKFIYDKYFLISFDQKFLLGKEHPKLFSLKAWVSGLSPGSCSSEGRFLPLPSGLGLNRSCPLRSPPRTEDLEMLTRYYCWASAGHRPHIPCLEVRPLTGALAAQLQEASAIPLRPAVGAAGKLSCSTGACAATIALGPQAFTVLLPWSRWAGCTIFSSLSPRAGQIWGWLQWGGLKNIQTKKFFICCWAPLVFKVSLSKCTNNWLLLFYPVFIILFTILLPSSCHTLTLLLPEHPLFTLCRRCPFIRGLQHFTEYSCTLAQHLGYRLLGPSLLSSVFRAHVEVEVTSVGSTRGSLHSRGGECGLRKTKAKSRQETEDKVGRASKEYCDQPQVYY